MSKRSESRGAALRATCTAVRAIVESIHAGTTEAHPVPDRLAADRAYWTPSFRRGVAPSQDDSKVYSAGHLQILLTIQGRSRYVELALLLLELEELGEITTEDAEKIFSGEDDYSLERLRSILLNTRNDHYDLAVQEEATEILSAV